MACKPSPGEFITTTCQKVDIYWRMALSHAWQPLLETEHGAPKNHWTSVMWFYKSHDMLHGRVHSSTRIWVFGTHVRTILKGVSLYAILPRYEGTNAPCFTNASWHQYGRRCSVYPSPDKIDTPNLTCGYLWLQCNRGSFSNGDKFPTPCLGCMQCLSNSCHSDNDNVEEMEETWGNYLTSQHSQSRYSTTECRDMKSYPDTWHIPTSKRCSARLQSSCKEQSSWPQNSQEQWGVHFIVLHSLI